MIRQRVRWWGLCCWALATLSAAVLRAEEAQPLTLAETLACALNHHPRVAAAVAGVQAARAGVSLASGARHADFTLAASAKVQGPAQEIRLPIGPGRVQITPTEQLLAALQVQWPLWTGGRVEAAVGAARAQVGVAEADLQQSVEQVLFEAAEAFYGVLRARQGLVAAAAELSRAAELHRRTRVAWEAGATTRAQVAGAAAHRRQAEQAQGAARNALRHAEQSFNRALGRALEEPVLLAEGQVLYAGAYQTDEALSLARERRPELLALDYRLDSAAAALALARAERNPTVNLVGQYALQTPTDVVPSHAESLGLQFSWPVFEHAGPRAQEARARAAAEQVQRTREDLEALIDLQVAAAERALAETAEQVSARQEALAAAEQAAGEARAGYRAGALSRPEVVEAEAALTAAQAGLAQAEYARSLAGIAYWRALGMMRELVLIPAEEVVP